MRKLKVLLALLCIAAGLSAQTWNIGSPIATNVTATLSNGKLTISGTGAMENWANQSYVPWYNDYRKTITTVVIEDGVTSIGNYAFYGYSGLESVNIGDNVETIGSSAFYGCSGLTSVTIPDGVTSIGREAFEGCSGLTGALSIPNSVTSIAAWAFYNCSGLTSLNFPASVVSIGNYAFSSVTNLTSVAITGTGSMINFTSGGAGAPWHNSIAKLNSVTIGDSVTSIGNNAFYNCSGLTSIIIPKSVTSIGSDAFYGCSGLTEINVDANNSNYSSDDGILYNKDITTLIKCPGGKQGEYTIPNTVTSIGNSAFRGCSGLTGALSIPEGVTSIENYAFYGCSGLTFT